MTIQERITAFTQLGKFLTQFSDKVTSRDASFDSCNAHYSELFHSQIDQAVHHNGWFTKENVLFAIETWANTLTEENIKQWIAPYDFLQNHPKTVGVVTAGNIPLVGFHDFITVLMSGNKILIKQSSNDQKLLPVLADFLICIAPEFKEYIAFTDTHFTQIDAVIATGSNNTARYFEYYFNKYPHIIRQSRNAVAILTGQETPAELEALGDDIFRYFGLGCRSVSKILVPVAYDFEPLLNAFDKQEHYISYRKYKNNYDYNKTVYLMSRIPILDNGFLILKEDPSYASPIATLFYEYYTSETTLNNQLMIDRDKIQCTVTHLKLSEETIPFGKTQVPQLWDYADGVDTMEFLLNL